MFPHGWSYIPVLMPVVYIKSVLSACRCHFFKVWGSLIPQPSIDAWETDQIKQQAIRVIMTLKVLRNTVFKMIEIWQHHAETDIQKRLASVHSTVGRGSLIPHHRFARLEFATPKGKPVVRLKPPHQQIWWGGS